MKLSLLLSAILSISSINAYADNHVKGSSSDPGVINQERILYWLEKRGEISSSASDFEKELAIKNYLSGKSFEQKKLPGQLASKVRTAESFNNKHASVKSFTINQNELSANDVETTVKVLAIMVDFPDLPHDDNRLTANDTSMYYDDYNAQHYNDLLFSTTGYEGPSGQNIESGYQFYQQESGGTFFFTGQANGWVTASKNAAEYGGNDADNDDNDIDATGLVLEAVTKAVSELNIDLSEYDKSDFFDIDGDGNKNEPDGIIDHVMIFHSSVGEEAGGGVLGEDAIWSHRFFVFDSNNQPVNIPGSDIKLYGYTINPIDAATGVTVHEFGHDLGLPDEYDIANGPIGSPVANWSVMASGSWLGSPAGTRPASFSAYALDFFNNRYEGNWINQQVIALDDLEEENISLVNSSNHDGGVNQLKVTLPPAQLAFEQAYAGDFQYYSNAGHLMNNRMSFDVTLPSSPASLTMTARWDIEVDYDYVQILVDGNPIAGSQTKATNAFHNNVTNFITGQSSAVSDAEGPLSWVPLTFDLTSFANQTVTIEIAYITDPAVGGYGFVADEISVDTTSENIFSSGAETLGEATLNGFSRVSNTIDGADHHYYIQMRNQTDNDLYHSNIGYDSGVLVWYRNENLTDNKVNEHPGEVFVGVVDADQDPIGTSNTDIRNTSTQLRDAAFSLFDQTAFSDDSSLTANPIFSDLNDYSFPLQPESGIKLPKYGFTMEVVTQNTDSSVATIKLSKTNVSEIATEHTGLTVDLTLEDSALLPDTTVTWQMGDGVEKTGVSISHTYATAGSFNVSVNYQTAEGMQNIDRTLTVGALISGTISASVSGSSASFTSNLTGGEGDFIYRWDFGDNSNSSSAEAPTHSYENAGNYTVTLTVTDETLQSYAFTTTVEVLSTVSMVISHQKTNLAVTFGSNATGGDGQYSYLWDFGDSSTSTEQDPSHAYASAGTYTVTLTVTDGTGGSVSDTVSVTVTAPAVTTPTTNTSSSGGGGGGSFGFISLLSLLLISRLRLSK